jgi:hypothetical protein
MFSKWLTGEYSLSVLFWAFTLGGGTASFIMSGALVSAGLTATVFRCIALVYLYITYIGVVSKPRSWGKVGAMVMLMVFMLLHGAFVLLSVL